MKPLRRSPLLWPLLLVVGCSTTSTEDDDGPVTTVRLTIADLSTSAGEASDGTLPVGCVDWATIAFGPTEDAGVLDRFTLSSPGSCAADTDACGFIELRIAADGGESVRKTSLLTVASFEIPAGSELEVSATLIQGRTLEPYRNPDGEEVTVSRTYALARNCEAGLGGAGGMGSAEP